MEIGSFKHKKMTQTK